MIIRHHLGTDKILRLERNQSSEMNYASHSHKTQRQQVAPVSTFSRNTSTTTTTNMWTSSSPPTSRRRHCDQEYQTKSKSKTTTAAATRLSHRMNPHHLYQQHHLILAILFALLQAAAFGTTQLATTLQPAIASNTNSMIQSTTQRTVEMAARAANASKIDNAAPTTAEQQINNSDINKQLVLAQNQPIEQVAKAEALTSSASSPVAAVMSSPPRSPAAALQAQQPTKLFEVCKMQSRMGQQLTNLSQIMFQPSDICSTWHKMYRTPADSTSNSEYPWHYIEQLNLSNNNLTLLHDSSGMNRLVNLLDLRITHNQLSRCEESSLVGLQRLQILDLSHNRLVALPPKFFQPVKHTIKKLNLSFNSITVLVPNLFDSLNHLEYLDLSHNDITSHWINDKLFKNLTQLHYLDLSFNKIDVLSPMAFSSLQQLETLSLQHNELRQVPDTIQHLRYLSSLDLSQNLIHDITNASYLSNCRLLFNLNLESNLLENISRDAFSDLPALKVLNLANNRIHHLDQQAFECKYPSPENITFNFIFTYL